VSAVPIAAPMSATEESRLRLHLRRKRTNVVALTLALAAMAFGIFWLVWILIETIRLGLGGLSLSLFTEMTPPPQAETGGLANAIFGSLAMVTLATLLGTPIGILAGIYLAEYGQRSWLGGATRFINDILLSAPSIVIGLFIYTVVVARTQTFSGAAGVLALALIVIPVVIRTTENILAARRTRRRDHRRPARLRAHRRRDGAAPLHRTLQPVLDQRPVAADGEPAGDDLQVRDEPLRELAEARVGRRVPDHPRRLDPEHRRPHLLPQPDLNTAMNAPLEPLVTEAPKLSVRNLNFYYGGFHALKSISLDIPEKRVTAFIGPSGCGKSTLLRTFNRMYELYPEQRAEGEIIMDGSDLLKSKEDVSLIRAKVGMVFQKPTPFPMSIYDNIAFGVKLFESLPRVEMDERVEWALRKAALWTEVKDKLDQSGAGLSGGQQQRLCIARGIAIRPEVLLLDEPCSALDPISTGKIEELIHELKTDYTVVIVTHNMQQAARCSDFTAYMYLGDLIEFGRTNDVFMRPRKKDTEDYITGRFG